MQKKIRLLGLKNIILIKGDFKKTIPSFFKKNTKKKDFAANIDCDLYDSYTTVLTHTWPRLNKNGIILLDEYYSLKFPGARIAADDFFKTNKIKPFKKKSWSTDFERWYIKKNNIICNGFQLLLYFFLDQTYLLMQQSHLF